MKSKELFISLLIVFVGVGTMSSSCSDDDNGTPDFPPIDRGDITSNRFFISFSEGGDPNKTATYEYYDNGSNVVADTIKLRQPNGGSFLRYESEIEFLLNNDTVTGKIDARPERHIVCYRNMNSKNLRLGASNVDEDGQPIGTEAEWRTISENETNGTGVIRITLNYQPLAKEGICDPGTRIIEGILPYRITN